MYLIKNIYCNNRTNEINIESGIKVVILEKNEVVVRDEFWGKTEINLGIFADFTKIPNINEGFKLLSYVNEYKVEDIGDGFKKLFFNVSEYNGEKKEGYIIFVKKSINEIKTNGQKIFGRYPTEAVVILKNKNYHEFDNVRIEVIGEQLVLPI